MAFRDPQAATSASDIAASALATNVANAIQGSNLATNIATLVAASNLPTNISAQIVASALAQNIANKVVASTLAADISHQVEASLLADNVAIAANTRGIPGVWTQVVLANGSPTLAVGASVTYDVSNYASMAIRISAGSGSGGVDATITQSYDSSNIWQIWSEAVQGDYTQIVEVRGKYLTIQNSSLLTQGLTLLVVASNRPVTERVDGDINTAIGSHYYLNSTVMAAGSTYTFLYDLPRGNVQGQAFFHARINNAIKGEWFWVMDGPRAPSIRLADTGEGFAGGGTGNPLVVSKMIAMPRASGLLKFVAAVGGTTTPTVDIVKA